MPTAPPTTPTATTHTATLAAMAPVEAMPSAVALPPPTVDAATALTAAPLTATVCTADTAEAAATAWPTTPFDAEVTAVAESPGQCKPAGREARLPAGSLEHAISMGRTGCFEGARLLAGFASTCTSVPRASSPGVLGVRDDVFTPMDSEESRIGSEFRDKP